MRDVCDIAEHVSELADRGEVDDINYANLKAIPRKRLICGVSILTKWGNPFMWLQKRLLSDKK